MARVLDYARRILLDWRLPWVVEQEIDAELQFHIDCTVDDLIADGWEPLEARFEANRRFGNRIAIKERCALERNILICTIEHCFAIIAIPFYLVFLIPCAVMSLIFDPD